jgi:cell fate regulator YaaT (PSP1 superfamily)
VEEIENNNTNIVTDNSDLYSNVNIRAEEGGCYASCNSGCNKLDVTDWLKDINEINEYNDNVEVRFKNTRKAYFQNNNNLRLKKGDIVAVEASPGHDIGIVSLTGHLVRYKMQVEGVRIKDAELKKVYRKAKPADIEKWKEAISLEHSTMIKSRQISSDLKLNMKIGDVEYQGDRTKAIFYYIADERVDFRQLIKVLAEQFKIRVEMRQIGARQEAGRIGGIGSCGRELCCSSWMTNFVSVTTNAARYQEVSLNPQKLAGQCGKLKCCMNYELDAYLDAQKDFPDTAVSLKTKEGKAYHQKTDVFKGLMWYIYEEDNRKTLTCMTVETVKDVIKQNANNQFPEKLIGVEESATVIAGVHDYQNSVGSESLTRFEDKPSKNKGGNKVKRKGNSGNKKNFSNNKRKDNRPSNSGNRNKPNSPNQGNIKQ